MIILFYQGDRWRVYALLNVFHIRTCLFHIFLGIGFVIRLDIGSDIGPCIQIRLANSWRFIDKVDRRGRTTEGGGDDGIPNEQPKIRDELASLKKILIISVQGPDDLPGYDINGPPRNSWTPFDRLAWSMDDRCAVQYTIQSGRLLGPAIRLYCHW